MPTHDDATRQAQLNFFHTFGYLRLPGLLCDDIDEIIAAFEAIWQERGGGHAGRAHTGDARSCIVPFIDQHPRLCQLLDDPRIEGLLCDILGEGFNYVGSDGNFYSGDTAWHSDGMWSDGPMFLKVALYLDPVGWDSGALRVIPGSHHRGDAYADGLQQFLHQSQDQWGTAGSNIPAIAMTSAPGDVVIFNHKLKHSAWGGSKRRRMFTINCSQRFPDDKLDDLRGYINSHARFWIDRLYGPIMRDTADTKRMTHLEQVMANDGDLVSLAAKAREEMAEPARG